MSKHNSFHIPYNETSEYRLATYAGETSETREQVDARCGIVSFDTHEEAKAYFLEKGIDIDEVNKNRD